MPPLRLERECKERTNSATIDYRCVEFDRREPTESVAERLPQVNPYGKSTETSTEHCHCEERSDVAIQSNNAASSSGLPRSRWSLAMTCCAAFTMAEILLSLTIISRA